MRYVPNMDCQVRCQVLLSAARCGSARTMCSPRCDPGGLPISTVFFLSPCVYSGPCPAVRCGLDPDGGMVPSCIAAPTGLCGRVRGAPGLGSRRTARRRQLRRRKCSWARNAGCGEEVAAVSVDEFETKDEISLNAGSLGIFAAAGRFFSCSEYCVRVCFVGRLVCGFAGSSLVLVHGVVGFCNKIFNDWVCFIAGMTGWGFFLGEVFMRGAGSVGYFLGYLCCGLCGNTLSLVYNLAGFCNKIFNAWVGFTADMAGQVFLLLEIFSKCEVFSVGEGRVDGVNFPANNEEDVSGSRLLWLPCSTGVYVPTKVNSKVLREYEECVFNFCHSQAWNDGGLSVAGVALHLVRTHGVRYSFSQRVVKRLLDHEILVRYPSGEVYTHASLLKLP